ncbi:S1C family serine protease [Aristaeella lactis]|uniref:Serine protease Do n=1 Tax=Aristaeella lactis TaxID=3046383 RepID=A0AC61PMC3_9FIRM|nr:trypsin-like peptidase domain-containing protein [Aristaeella lactis]QUA53111.1 trypsin-like peptidase domain-containing protein [Aristaeella lactis]SMC67703.1 serine protease Do [Aristaeella lactis]
MRKILNHKVMGIIALALVCVFAGTVIGAAQPAANAEEKVVLTSPFTEAIAKVRDSVVGVNNYQIVNNNYGGYDNFGGYFPWSYFGGYGNGYGSYGYTQPDSSQEVKYGSGSGVVIAKEYVLTNYHVVEGAHSLKISLDEDEKNLYDATVVASDADKDVAVLQVPGLPLEPVELGNSDDLVIGDWVVCIGNPIGFTGTATAGIVSGLNREIASESSTIDKYGRNSQIVNSMIQTDAAINSGNSGGGMFNTAGQLVGIPTLKYSGTRYSSNAAVESIGMCIPINEAKDIIEAALNGEGAAAEPADTENNENTGNDLKGKPRMGVTVSTVKDTRGQLPRGVYIEEVEKDSPAEAAGLQVGDIMVEVNGQVITSVTEEVEIIAKLKEGDEVAVKVFRPDQVYGDGRISYDGEYVDLTVKLAMVDSIAQ